jgi:hypothetical protein
MRVLEIKLPLARLGQLFGSTKAALSRRQNRHSVKEVVENPR